MASSHLTLMYNQLGIPQRDQGALATLHGITNFETLKAKQQELENGELQQVDSKAQVILAVAIVYLDSLRCASDPVDRFSKIEWVDFCIKHGNGPNDLIDLTEEVSTSVESSDDDSSDGFTNDDDDDSDDDQHVPRFKPARRKTNDDKVKQSKPNQAKEPIKLGKFELMEQGFTPGISEFYDPTDDADKANDIEASMLKHVVFNGRTFFKGRCYQSQNGKGEPIIVAIKSFKSDYEAYCVRVIKTTETFLGTGDHSDEFRRAMEKYNSSVHVQVRGTAELLLSDIGKECSFPHPAEIPDLIYEPRIPGSSQSFGYVRDTGTSTCRNKQVRIRRKEMRLMEAFSGAGGMHLGYKEEGFATAMAVELNDVAVDTFELNNPGVPTYRGDVNKFIEKFETDPDYRKSLGNIDAVHVSSPCQGFSKANRFGGQNDEINNKLSYTFVHFLRISNAKIGVFENVEGMWSTKGMSYLRKLLVGCIGLGYQVRVQILRGKCHFFCCFVYVLIVGDFRASSKPYFSYFLFLTHSLW